MSVTRRIRIAKGRLGVIDSAEVGFSQRHVTCHCPTTTDIDETYTLHTEACEVGRRRVEGQ